MSDAQVEAYMESLAEAQPDDGRRAMVLEMRETYRSLRSTARLFGDGGNRR